MASLLWILAVHLLPSLAVADEALPSVVELAYIDPALGKEADVRVRFHADGRVEALGENGDRATSKLPESLHKLAQRELFVECRVLEIDSEKLAQQLDSAASRSGKAWRIEGSAETVITSIGPRGRYEIRCSATGLNSTRFPDIDTLQNFHRAERRLLNLAAIAQAGGVAQLEGYLRSANQSCQQEAAQCPELTVSDLCVFRSSDGFDYLQFRREFVLNDAESSEKRNCSVLVSVVDRPGNPYQVVTLVGRGSPGQTRKESR